MGEPKDLVLEGAAGLTAGPFLVRVDRYGSVSGLVKVKVPIGVIVIKSPELGEGSLWHVDQL